MFPATKAAYDAHPVDIEQWPRHPGQRPLCADSGRAGGIRGEDEGDRIKSRIQPASAPPPTEGLFTFKWEGDALTAINNAVGGNYITGRIPAGQNTRHRKGDFWPFDISPSYF